MNDILRVLMDNEERLKQTETKEVPQFGAGTAFPAAPTTGMRFFRTDLGFLCYYDGTRWLTAHEYSVERFFDNPAAGTYAIAPLRSDYAPYITRRATMVRTGATNTGAAYWTVTILGANGTQTATTTIDVANTSAQGANVWATGDVAPSSTSTPANAAALDVSLVATGAPTVLVAIGFTIYYRLIVT